jgi:hypothetical protein
MAAAGQSRPGFTLRYSSEEDRWIFVLGDRDSSDEVAWITLRSAGQPAVGVWTHLAVRVDPAARHMRMYVDGQPSGEREIPWATWNAAGPMYVGCSGPASGDTWGYFDGAVHHVGVWQGLLTPAQIQAAYQGELPAGVTGDWRLRGDGTDASAFRRDMQTPPGAVWVDDQYGRQRSALRFDGTGWAEGTAPVVQTDRSFSVAGWVRLDDKGDFRTVVSQGGVFVTTFNLNYHHEVDRWQLSMSSHDDEDLSSVVWHRARSNSAPVVGQWYHLVGVFDAAAGQLRLYVNGQLQGTGDGPAQPWPSESGLLIGTGGNTSGERSNRMVGALSDVKTWRGALTDEQVVAVYGGNPAIRQLSQWTLNEHGDDPVGGHTLELVGVEGVDYEWVEDRVCFPFSALGLRISGEGYAHTAGPVAITDESFTVAAWVKLDSLTGEDQTVLAQRGSGLPTMSLRVTPAGSWAFSIPQRGTAAPGTAVSPPGLVEVGVWTHLTGVFDLGAGEVRLYVDGEPAGVAEASLPLHVDGPFYIGASGAPDGVPNQPVHGSIDTVSVWSSTLDPDRIAEIGRPLPSSGLC